MGKVRIEIHIEEDDVRLLDQIAEEQGRSRKNLCETEIKKVIAERKKKSKPKK